jgi:hypothetical protein
MSADRKWRTTGFLFPGCPARVAGVGKFFEVSSIRKFAYEQVSTLNLYRIMTSVRYVSVTSQPGFIPLV